MLSEKISTLKLPAPLCVESGISVGQVVEEVQRHKVGCVLIQRGDKVIGIMTERDVLLKIVARDVSSDAPVDEFMTPDPVTLRPHNTIRDAIKLMNERNFRHIPILDENGKAVALFSIRQVIDHLAESFPEKVINLPPRPHQKMLTREGA